MNPKPSDLLNRIPTVNELLDKPPVRALADRWCRSTVAAGLRSFLDEVRTDLQRRASTAGIPSARELAERAARFVMALQANTERPAINATGRITGTPFTATPLDDSTLERVAALGREFLVGPSEAGDQRAPALATDAISTLCRLTGAQAATAAHSYSGAIWLAFSAVVEDRKIVVARSQLGDADPGCGIAQLASDAGKTICEIGSTNRVRVSDYEAATDEASVVMRACSDEYAIRGGSEAVGLEALLDLAHKRSVPVIDAIGGAPLVDLSCLGGMSTESASASIAKGADLVIVRGDGLVGGPSCGLILGRRELVKKLIAHPLYSALRLDALRSAALASTLEALESKGAENPSLPIHQLLAAPVENLCNRAERIVQQLSETGRYVSAVAVPTRSPLFASAGTDEGMTSYAVSLSPVDGDVSTLERDLAAAPHGIVGRVEGNNLLLDLRTVFPRQDQSLVATILDKANAGTAGTAD